MTIRLITLVFLFGLCSTVFGESVAPPPVSEITSVPATLKSDPVQEISFGSFLAKFEKTTLKEIRDTIGFGSIEHSGDAGGSQYWLCYSLPRQRIWLISNGEMGGPDHSLTQVQAISTSLTSQVNDICPLIPNHLQPVSFRFGWIGTDRIVLFQALGQPSGMQGGSFIYYYEGKAPGVYYGQSVDWDVLSYVEVKIVDDKVTSLYVSHVTSY